MTYFKCVRYLFIVCTLFIYSVDVIIFSTLNSNLQCNRRRLHKYGECISAMYAHTLQAHKCVFFLILFVSCVNAILLPHNLTYMVSRGGHKSLKICVK